MRAVSWDDCQDYPWMTDQAWIALQPHRERIEQWLVESAGDPRHGRLLLHCVLYRITPAVEALLANGASARIQPYDSSMTSVFMPLNYAVSASEQAYDPALFDLLLRYGADPDECQPGVMLSKSVMAAAIDNPDAVADMLLRGIPADQLRVVKEDSTKTIMENETPLHLASMGMFDKHTPRWKRRAGVRLLLEAGADIEAPDAWKQTPLMLAVVFAPYLVGILVRHGANIDCLNRDNEGIEGSIVQASSNLSKAYGSSLFRRLASIRMERYDGATAPAPSRDRAAPRL